MKSMLIMCYTDPSNAPRPSRIIHYLKDLYNVTVVGLKDPHINGVEFIPLMITDQYERIAGKFKTFVNLKLHRFEEILWSENLRQLQNKLNNKFDLINVHDIRLLPVALSLKKDRNVRVWFDAHEYYPKNFDDQLVWRLFEQSLNEYICRKYLKMCDKMTTVCDGLAAEYAKVYGINAEVIMSLPIFSDLLPSQTEENKIKIIHHGWASPSRKIETMVKIMDYTDERFSLDLMLLPGDNIHHKWYWKKLLREVCKRKNVKLIPPVAMQNIVSFTNQYDIGLFLCKPQNFNLKFALPNKIFEFIQARLAIAIAPSIEMRKIVEKYDCGVISDDFEPKSLAKSLNKLTTEKIMYYKHQSHSASYELSAETNHQKIDAILHQLIGN